MVCTEAFFTLTIGTNTAYAFTAAETIMGAGLIVVAMFCVACAAFIITNED